MKSALKKTKAEALGSVTSYVMIEHAGIIGSQKNA
jgi:hypothetical protein